MHTATARTRLECNLAESCGTRTSQFRFFSGNEESISRVGRGAWAYRGTVEIRYADQRKQARDANGRRPAITDLGTEIIWKEGGSAMTKETTGANKPDVQDDHAPSKIGPRTANTSKEREKKSQLEGPAAYAPHDESEKSNR